MAAIATETATEIKLTPEAVDALVTEARSDLETGARELYGIGDESQRATIAASVEIIGRLSPFADNPWAWPKKDTPIGKEDEPFVVIAFSGPTTDWLRWNREQVQALVADFDTGAAGGDGEPGYVTGQVYLLHVLDWIIRQTDEGTVA